MRYITAHKRQLLDSLENQVLYADLVCVLVGESGCGKSFLLQRLQKRLESEVFISQVQAQPAMTREQLEKTICLQLGLSWQNSELSLLEKLKQQGERRALLTVDDAEVLSQSCLDYLMALVEEQFERKETRLFVVMAGESALANKLNSTPTLKQNPSICALFELLPFDPTELVNLLADFQRTNEQAIRTLFDEQKLSYFYDLSRGNLGELKYHLKRWTEEQSQVASTNNFPKKSLLTGMGYFLIAILLISALIFQDEINQVITPEPKKELAELDKKGTSSKDKKLNSEQKPKSKQKPKETVSSEQSEVENATAATKELTPGLQSTDSLDSSKQLSSVSRKALKEPVTTKEESINRVQPEEEAQREPATNSSIAVESNVSNDEQAKVSSSDVSSSEPVALQNTDNTVQRNEPDVKTSDEVLPKKEEKTTSRGLEEDKELILTLPDNGYTLQWAGVSKLEAATRFRDSHPLAGQMYIYQRQSSQPKLFLIISGHFNSRLDAENASVIYKKRNYPGAPWIKSVRAVKKEVVELAR
ncbi:AAA family ATPase [Aliikangiella sp. G2MR2-5]|uniref:AAA family ATPase n=1 Tax=Aliikangiella sp. G2MR2-5 TaxID=2788943 RepID=UPI0018AA20F3|nr:AAA family ATPase [Aliikangiella sp. G2MR2-5]